MSMRISELDFNNRWRNTDRLFCSYNRELDLQKKKRKKQERKLAYKVKTVKQKLSTSQTREEDELKVSGNYLKGPN